jgi:hypothetical protein
MLPAHQVDLQEDRFDLYRRGACAEIVTDDQASNGKAARMPGERTDWAVQFHVPPDEKLTGRGPWVAYLVVRCESKPGNGPAFLYGLYDPQQGRAVALVRGDRARAGDGKYHAYGVPIESLRAGMYFWAAPIGDPNAAKAVYVDRIFIQKQTDGGEAK